jgi:hypothetical protein
LCRAVALSLPEVANSCIQESQHTRKDWLYSFHWKKPANPFIRVLKLVSHQTAHFRNVKSHCSRNYTMAPRQRSPTPDDDDRSPSPLIRNKKMLEKEEPTASSSSLTSESEIARDKHDIFNLFALVCSSTGRPLSTVKHYPVLVNHNSYLLVCFLLLCFCSCQWFFWQL